MRYVRTMRRIARVLSILSLLGVAVILFWADVPYPPPERTGPNTHLMEWIFYGAGVFGLLMGFRFELLGGGVAIGGLLAHAVVFVIVGLSGDPYWYVLVVRSLGPGIAAALYVACGLLSRTNRVIW